MLKMTKTWTALCISSAFALAACNGDDTGDTEATATMTMTTPTTMPTTMTSSGSTSTDPSTSSGSTSTDPTDATTTTTTDPTMTTVAETDTDPTGDDPFIFDTTPPDMLTKVDRMGMPAINTAVITSKDDYNAASPADDVMGGFVPEIVANIDGFHAALDDDLIGLTLVPCMTDACVAAAAPLVVPDTLKINLEADAGFPNGRLLADPVMDVTLALVLLDLNVHSVTLFAELPLNPPANDKAFLADFPYLADPH